MLKVKAQKSSLFVSNVSTLQLKLKLAGMWDARFAANEGFQSLGFCVRPGREFCLIYVWEQELYTRILACSKDTLSSAVQKKFRKNWEIGPYDEIMLTFGAPYLRTCESDQLVSDR